MEPSAVTIHERSDIAPTFAMFAGSIMMPDPIMLTATSTVSCIMLIFFVPSISASSALIRSLSGWRRVHAQPADQTTDTHHQEKAFAPTPTGIAPEAKNGRAMIKAA
ncbi:hypothetical protein [Dyella sp. EPa41]|uniref:hypothetical protein n=1 Tax=Dyella sp. EPa41 TaxID=1561194 RepID=UPI001F37B5F9|nr:hypothetical protein [Dyella sp. EPa41]